MKRLLFALLLLAIIIAALPARASSPHTIYFPMMYSGRTDGLGLHIQRWTGPPNQTKLTALYPVFIRTIFGDDTGESIYPIYLSGGWSAVDTYVLPDLNSIKAYSEPLISFTHGGICKVPTNTQLNLYAKFLSDFTVRYDITYFEVWNEPDAKSGIPSLLGCFGDQYASKLIYLIGKVRETLPADKMLGVSFMLANSADFAMFQAVIPYLDWVGVHHYGLWETTGIVEPYPGTIEQLYDLVTPQSIPVFLTETNLRDDNTVCSPQFREDQAEYNKNTMYSDFEVKIILVFAGSSNWQCTGIKGSLTEEMLLTLPQLWIWDK